MAQKEYNPRVNNYRPEGGLRGAVSSAQIYSYDEKRPDFVAYQQDPGAEWKQLAKALSSFQPALAQYAEDKQVEENRINWTTAEQIGLEQKANQKSAEEAIAALPSNIAKWPPARRAIYGVYGQGEGEAYKLVYQEAYRNEGAANLAPEEFQQWNANFDLNYRQKLAERGYSPDALAYFSAAFNPAAQKVQSALMSQYAQDRNQIEFGRLEQGYQEGTYKVLQAAEAEGFFNPASLEQNQQNMAQRLIANRDALITSGVPRHLADAWTVRSVLNYAATLDLGEDDFRDHDVMAILDHLPSSAGGMLGQTAEVKAERDKVADSNRSRRITRENHRKADKEKKLEDIAKNFGREYLDGQPDFKAACQKYGYDPNDLDVSTTWNKAMDAQEKAASVVETQANRQFAADMELGVLTGKVSYQDIAAAFEAGKLTVPQHNRILDRKYNVDGKESPVNRLAGQAGLNDALKRVTDTLGKVGREGEDLTTDPALVAVRQQIAGELFTRNVLADLYALNEDSNLTASAREQKARQIVNDAAAYFLADGRETVFEAADAALQNSFMYRPAVTQAYDTMGQQRAYGTTAPVFKPSPDSILNDLSETEVAWAENAERTLGLPEASLLTFVAASRAQGIPMNTSSPEAMNYWGSLIRNQADAMRKAGTEPTAEDIMEMIMPGYGEKVSAVSREKYQHQLQLITPVIGARLINLETAANAVAAFQKGQRVQALAGLEAEFNRAGVNPSRQLLGQALYAVYNQHNQSASESQRKRAKKILSN